MTIELVTVPCLLDQPAFLNYSYLIHNSQTGETVVVDPPETGPINAALEARGWALSHILLTHHHWDHVDGVAPLLETHSAQVIGAAQDAHRLPPLDIEVMPGTPFTLAGTQVEVFDVPGHTVGHVAYYIAEIGALLSGDSLMAGGCGRLFEGTPAQMWASLQQFRDLPPETLICSGHEYTQSNLRFALTLEPDNSALISRLRAVDAARAAAKPTVPTKLADEMATNPFLRADVPALKAAMGLPEADALDVFTQARKRKDNF